MSTEKIRKNYGTLYFDALQLKSAALDVNLVEVNSKHIESKSQNVYTLLPSDYNYRNTAGVCKQLCLLATALFLDSNSLLEYTRTFAGVLKALSSPQDKDDALSTLSGFFGKRDVLDKHFCKSKFVTVDEISSEIMSRAINLKDAHKFSLIITIGGHVVSVLMSNIRDRIAILYYDPYFSQIYKQSVHKSEIKKVLNGHANFVHLMSILNSNGILLGKIYSRHPLYPDIPFMLITQCSDSRKKPSVPRVELSKNVPMNDLTKYLGKDSAIFNVMFYTMQKDTLHDLLAHHKKPILQTIGETEKCVTLVKKCSNDYLKDSLLVHSKTANIREAVDNHYYDLNNIYFTYRYDKDSSKAVVQDRIGKICIKDAEFVKFMADSEKEFLSFLMTEQRIIWNAISQCVDAPSLLERDKIAHQACEKFTEEHSKKFYDIKLRYYGELDALEEQESICFNKKKTLEIMGDSLTNIHDEL